MPAIYLDLFADFYEFERAMDWRYYDLARCVKARGNRPMIVEGVLLLDALAAIGRAPDYLVFVKKLEPQRSRDRGMDDDLDDPRPFALTNQVSRYFQRRDPLTLAKFRLEWADNSVSTTDE
jgi:hypothetical protein